ncbi:MAG: 4Fe-4S binding protein [Chitinivibrionales bacterium]
MKKSSIRRVIQGLSFTAFLVLFGYTVYPHAGRFPVSFFTRIDPFVAVTVSIATRTVIWGMAISLVVLLSSFIFGRGFCGYVCPLGIMQDIVRRISERKGKSSGDKSLVKLRGLKYIILIACIAAAVFGFSLIYFTSPASIATRFFTMIVFPGVTAAANTAIDFLNFILGKADIYALSRLSFDQYVFTSLFSSLLLFLLVFIPVIFVSRRFWCRYVCPTGALLGLLSRFSIYKYKIDKGKCKSCGLCSDVCPMDAIDTEAQRISVHECIMCGLCTDVCNLEVISLTTDKTTSSGPDFSGRRGFIGGVTAGIALGVTGSFSVGRKKDVSGRLIRPPGSVPEFEFNAQCIRCGECIKVCKTNGLQPLSFEKGVSGLWTPVLVPVNGPCEEKCNMCGQVCPSSAIRNLSLEEKSFVKMGTAVLDRSRCIAWEQGRLCLVCDEVCPYDAIDFAVVEDVHGMLRRPFVDEEKCVGCGQCEYSCPVLDKSAIEVFNFGEERKSQGSYMTEKKKKLREIEGTGELDYPNPSDMKRSSGESREYDGYPDKSPGDTSSGDSQDRGEEDLPPGFLAG